MKGKRYLPGVPKALAYHILERLPYASFEQAMAFYKIAMALPGFNRGPIERFLAANDRFYLLTVVLRRYDAQVEWLFDRCREVESDPDDHLDLWARYHYKSTIITFAGSIQEIIDDPEITIAIFGNTSDVAQPFLEQIMRECEENDHLKALFPDVFYVNPRKEAPTWSKDEGIVVRRKGNPKELTVQAFGIMEALPTGGHWRLRIYDDIVTLKSITQTQTDQVAKTYIRWQMSQNLGVHEGGRRWVIGTRYSYADAYSSMIEAQSVKTRIYPATHDGTLNGRPVFLTSAKWSEIKRDQRDTLSAQMLQNPVAGRENTFQVKWLRSFTLRPLKLNVYIIGDPAGRPSAKSDRTAIPVIGVDGAGNRFLIDGVCHKMGLNDRWLNLRNLFKKWKHAPGVEMVRCAWEKYGMQSDLEYFEEKMMEEKIDDMTIDEVSWTREGGQSKTARIGRLEPYFRNGHFFLPPKVFHPQHGVARWHIEVSQEPLMVNGAPVLDAKTGAMVMTDVEGSARIEYATVEGDLRIEIKAKADGEGFRVMEPIRRLDHDGIPYDVVRTFFEEYRLHPFAPKDDLIDAVSRIQDVDPVGPMSDAARREIESAGSYGE